MALTEVLLCSGFPTQLAIVGALSAGGITPYSVDGGLNLTWVVTLSLADTAVLVGLIILMLTSHGENPRAVLLGSRSMAREIRLGTALLPAVFVLAVVVLGLLRLVAPSLHTVDENPLESLMRNPRDAAIFAVVIVIAGGVREELQRAFLMHRFDRHLGGGVVGVVVTSVAFGAGHVPQGLDAAIATGLLGALWAVVYLRRRSAVAPIVSHAAFNLVQLAQFMLIAR